MSSKHSGAVALNEGIVGSFTGFTLSTAVDISLNNVYCSAEIISLKYI